MELNRQQFGPHMPDVQRHALTAGDDNELLDHLARNPQRGVHIFRGETRPATENPADAVTTGIHWSVDPDAAASLLPHRLEEGRRGVIWHGTLDNPEDALSRTHPTMTTYKTAPVRGDYEVRMRPGAQVTVHGAWTHVADTGKMADPYPFSDENHLNRGRFVPDRPELMDKGREFVPGVGYRETERPTGWRYQPVNKKLTADHKGSIDYGGLLQRPQALPLRERG